MRTTVFIFALLIRIAAIEATGAQAIAFGDGPDYVATARSVCTHHGYPERGNLPFFRAPGLPFFIAGVTACQPSRTRAVKYGLAVCDALSVLLIFIIAKDLWAIGRVIRRSPFDVRDVDLIAAPRGAALCAGVLAALHPFFIGGVTDIRSEPLFMMLLLAAMLLVLRDRPALAGIALGLAALTRPTALLCIPLFALFVALRTRALQRGALLVLTALLALAPWMARNYLRFHEVIPVNDAAGFNIWRGTRPDLLAAIETHDPKQFAIRSQRFESQTVSEAAKLVDARASTPAARDREWRRMAIENLRRDRSFAIKVTLKKAALFWRPWLHPAEHGPKARLVSVIVVLGLYVLAAIGMFLYPDRKLVVAVLLFFTVMWLAHVPYFPTIRLRAPLTDPLLIVFAGGAVAAIWTRVAAIAAARAARPS